MGNQSISVDTLPNNISNSPPSLASAMPSSPSYRQQPQQQHQQQLQQQKQQQASLNSSNAQLINSPPLQSSSPQEQQSGSPPNRFESTTLNQQLSIDVFILLDRLIPNTFTHPVFKIIKNIHVLAFNA